MLDKQLPCHMQIKCIACPQVICGNKHIAISLVSLKMSIDD